MSYSDLHRFLLRSVASRGVLTFQEAKDAIKKYPDNTQGIEDIVTDINREIKFLNQLIKITKDELTDEKILVFLSLACDGATKAQNFFSAAQYEFFELLLEEIMTAKNRQISDIYAKNLVGKMKGSLTETDVQSTLNTFCRMHYLDKTDTQYAIGVRAIHEFEGYLRDNLPDTIEECTLCKESVFRGYDCPTCGVAVHTRCLNRYLLTSMKWPCCKVDFLINSTQGLSEAQSSQNTTNEEVSHVDNAAVEPTQQGSEEMDVT